MIPPHKCTPYCEPDEGVHCLPVMIVDGSGIPRAYERLGEVIRWRPEPDATDAVVRRAWEKLPEGFRFNPMPMQTGYLIWVRDKEQVDGH